MISSAPPTRQLGTPILHSIPATSTKKLRSIFRRPFPFFRLWSGHEARDSQRRRCSAGAVRGRRRPRGTLAARRDPTRLRDYIVEGNIPDGGRVPERELCAMFGISPTPLREALKVLAAEGLVDLLPNRGARVRQLSERELGELFDVMGGLEGLAGRLACENITDEEIAEVERLHYEM